jgi:hypothetical protein
MIRKVILTLSALSLFGMASAQVTQKCATDEFHAEQKARYPEIAQYEAQLKQDVDNYLRHRALNPRAKGTGGPNTPWPQDTDTLHIPVAVHLIHTYGAPAPGTGGATQYITDAQVIAMIAKLNDYYNARNADLASVITPFKPYIGNFHIYFHLANKDPQGKPSSGITRSYSYLANGGDESAKLQQWPPDQYLNLYFENFIGRGIAGGVVLAYATFPEDYTSNPYSQGVISYAPAGLGVGDVTTVPHEVGHFFHLQHTWNSSGAGAGVSCGDDEVDDTPPTKGHFSTCPIYDTACATGYYKDYDSTDYYMITGDKGNFAYNSLAINTSVQIATGSSIGQSFLTGAAFRPLFSISVRVDSPSTSGDTTRMMLYNGSGALVATSSNYQIIAPRARLTYNFVNFLMGPNINYKFVINRQGTTSTPFKLLAFDKTIANQNDTFVSGQLYTGAGANAPDPNKDLYFEMSIGGRRIDYPDTANVQNIMDYSSCTVMFTKGQVARSRASLYSAVGFRNKLWSKTNLVATGILNSDSTYASRPDLKPVADFSVNRNFVCANSATTVTFTNRSYNDPLVTADWNISNTPTPTSNSLSSVPVTFDQVGWVNTKLTVANNVGVDTISKTLVYAADPNGISTNGYYQEFSPGHDLDKYPIFNFFGTDHRWEVVSNAGYFDNTSIRYANYDLRTSPTIANATQTPGGDYADFYTRAFDLSAFGPDCNLDFFSAGAFRTNKPSEMNDVLEIASSTDCGASWRTVATLTKGQIGNNGLVSYGFIPGWMGHWKEQSFPIGTLGRSDHTFFRFRYTAGTDIPTASGFSIGTGNNFYIDRLRITADPLGVKNGVIVNLGMSVAPNPTSGNAIVSLNGGDNSTAEVNVTDVTGKVVFHTSAVRKSSTTKIEIPASALTVKGMYLVQVVTNGATETQKLVVY